MSRISQPGTNCRTVAQADRLAFLIDADAYFTNLAAAMENAQRSIWIVGWDLHSEVRLVREGESPEMLVDMLDRLTAARPQLHVHLLVWDCNVLCMMNRETLQRIALGWRTTDRVNFHADATHANGACHHEKLVVIDDEMAFVGGIDITIRRWDQSDHSDHNDLRVDPSGNPYSPYHDVQVAVSGPIARELGDHARERWRHATGDSPEVPTTDSDPWPSDLSADLRDVPVGLSRTETHDEDAPTREIETLYLDALARATDSVFIENQYLSSDSIAQTLERLLSQKEGPEVCIVVPQRVSGWLEEVVMGRLRARVIARLRNADRHDHLRVWYPERHSGDQDLIVHSKLCIVDDRFLTIGSANLSNRSMGLDTECNVFIEGDNASRREAIAGLRNRLLAEHLGCAETEVAAAISGHASLNRAVDSLRGNDRTLRQLEPDPSALNDESSAVERVLDPEQPLEWSEFVERFFVG